MDVARLAGEPGAVGGTAPLDPCAPLGEGRLYWSAGPGAARSVCDQYVGEGLRAGRSSLPPQDAPIPEATLRPLYSPSTEGPPRDAAKHPQTSDPHDRRRSPFSSGLASTPPGLGVGEEEPGPGGGEVGASGRARGAGGWGGGRRVESGAGGCRICGWGAAPAATSVRPRAAEAGRAPLQAGIGAERAPSLGGRGGGHPVSPPPKFPGGAAAALPSQVPGVGATLGRELFPRAAGPPSSARPRASIASNSDSQLGRRRGPAHARLPLLLVLLPLESRLRAERAQRPALRALTRLPVLCSAHADAGRPPGAPSPEGQLNAGRRRGARWA